jgi:hypothetical protein
MADGMPTEANLTSRLLERLLDQAEAQSKSIQKLEFIVGQLASQVEKVAGRQELACEGIAKHLDDHRTERLAEAREGGRVEGYEEGRAVIPHRVETAADWLSHDLVKWVYPFAVLADRAGAGAPEHLGRVLVGVAIMPRPLFYALLVLVAALLEMRIWR